jgi:azurin
MKTTLLLLAGTTLLFSAAACGKKDVATPAPSATATPATAPTATGSAAAPGTTASTAATAPQARVIEIQATDAMKFSVTRIEASPGEQLQIKLVNVGTLPKEAMGHNLVLLKKGANPQTYANTAMTAKSNDYLPPSLSDQVVAATKMLGPKQTDTISFQVPSEPGEYPYLCSFPAHFVAGMKGVLVVR